MLARRPFFATFEPVQSQQVAFMVLVLLCIETCFTQVNSVGIWLADPVTRSVNQIRTFFTNIRKSKEDEKLGKARGGVVSIALFRTTIFKHDILKYAILGGGKIDFWSKLTILTKWDCTPNIGMISNIFSVSQIFAKQIKIFHLTTFVCPTKFIKQNLYLKS